MKDFSVARGTANLRGSEAGDGRGVVLVHAGVADRRSWFEVMELLSHRGFRCVSYDQRGHGDTTYDAEPYSATEDLLAVMTDRGVRGCTMVGCSRGGQIALDAALNAPEAVEALMLVGSAPVDAPFPPPSPEVAALFSAAEEADDAGDIDRVNRLEARIWLDGPLAPEGRAASSARELFLDMNGRALRAADTGTMQPFAPTWESLPRLEVPIAVLVGEHDLPSLRAAAEATAARIGHADFRLLPGTAHLPMLEQPSVVAEAIAGLAGRVV